MGGSLRVSGALPEGTFVPGEQLGCLGAVLKGRFIHEVQFERPKSHPKREIHLWGAVWGFSMGCSLEVLEPPKGTAGLSKGAEPESGQSHLPLEPLPASALGRIHGWRGNSCPAGPPNIPVPPKCPCAPCPRSGARGGCGDGGRD